MSGSGDIDLPQITADDGPVRVLPAEVGFGDVRVGTSSTLDVVIINRSDADPFAGDVAIDVGGTVFSTNVADVAFGGAEYAVVPVTYEPDAAGQDAGSLVLTSGQWQRTVDLTGTGVVSDQHLYVTPEVVQVKPEDGRQGTTQVTFSIGLDSLANYLDLTFRLDFPKDVMTFEETDVQVADAVRTDGALQAPVFPADGYMTVGFVDLTPPTVSSGTGAILTVTATVSTDPADVGAYPLVLSLGAEDPAVGTTVQSGQLVIGQSCTLDVDEENGVTLFDIIYLYRVKVLGTHEGNTKPAAYPVPANGVAGVIANVHCLGDDLDVDEENGVTLFDIVYMYRRAVLGTHEGNTKPPAYPEPAVGVAKVLQNIDRLLP